MTEPRKPEAWPTGRRERLEDQGHSQQPVPDAAERAMTSEHQAFAGAATGVEDVGFDAVGGFDVTEATRRRRAEAAADDDARAETGDEDLGPGAPAPNVTPKPSGS